MSAGSLSGAAAQQAAPRRAASAMVPSVRPFGSRLTAATRSAPAVNARMTVAGTIWHVFCTFLWLPDYLEHWICNFLGAAHAGLGIPGRHCSAGDSGGTGGELAVHREIIAMKLGNIVKSVIYMVEF